MIRRLNKMSLSLLPPNVSYRADADAGGGLAVAVWGGAAGGGPGGGQGGQGDELDALRQRLLLLQEVVQQLSLGLRRQLVEQRELGELLLQGQQLCGHVLKEHA